MTELLAGARSLIDSGRLAHRVRIGPEAGPRVLAAPRGRFGDQGAS